MGEIQQWHGTTILTVRKNGKVVIAGDGQVSLGQTVIKSNARKVRPLGTGLVIAGFAGMKTVSFAKKTNPALFFIVGALGVFLGQFAILYFGLKGIIDEVSAFRLFFDLLAAYIGSFIVASLVNIFSPY